MNCKIYTAIFLYFSLYACSKVEKDTETKELILNELTEGISIKYDLDKVTFEDFEDRK